MVLGKGYYQLGIELVVLACLQVVVVVLGSHIVEEHIEVQ